MEKQHSITIGIITFQRPQSLAATLESLAMLMLPPQAQVKLLVVDNDKNQSALSTTEAFKSIIPFPVEYALEERPGIPHARNKVLELAEASDYIAFIDDDDTADPNWLVSLYNAARHYAADVVKGQIIYRFPAGKSYLGTIDIFALNSQPTGAELASAWTNNVLFSTRIYKHGTLRFDLTFTHTGGSDNHFFRCAKTQGARIILCQEALVYTDVPEKRTTWKWITQRNLRVGSTITISDIKMEGYLKALAHVLHACSDSTRYCFRLLPGTFKGHVPLIHPAMVMIFLIGRIAGICRLSPREYRHG